MGRKRRKKSQREAEPAIPSREPPTRPQLSRWQQACIVLRHLVPLALLALFGGSVLQFLLLSVFNIAFTIAAIGTVGVAVSTRQEVVSTGWTDQLGALFALAAVCIGVSLVLTMLFGWVIALVASDEARGLWDPALWLGVLGIVASAVPGMVMQYESDLRARLPEEERKRRDRPEVGVQLFSAGFIFLLSGFTLGWERVGAVLLALLVTALFIFRDLRPDLARALAR